MKLTLNGLGCQSNFGTCGVTGPSVKWVSQGCYTDNPNKRTLRTALNVAQNSVEVCTAACAAQGFLYAGMEKYVMMSSYTFPYDFDLVDNRAHHPR